MLRRLAGQGNAVMVIEHDRQLAPAQAGVIRTADRVLDPRPDGGVRGGEIVAQGTPEDVAGEARSYTGAYLRPMLEKAREAVE